MACDRLSPIDPNSYARSDLCSVTHLDIDWDVDFGRQVLSGFVISTVIRHQDDVDRVILDTRNITIHKILDAEDGIPLVYNLEDPILTFGSKLVIQIAKWNNNMSKIKIVYDTVPSSTALQWFRPEQTAGKQHPYLFSQCQAIQARSMVPCQDTPSVKTTYTAIVKATTELRVLMSAIETETPELTKDGSKKIFKFEQKVCIPSYLIAIVVGALESRELSHRSRVWSEKEFVDLAAHDFAETEAMLQVAEDLMGPYIWGRYDILVLPPSFPFGGMENPCLTFVSPTLLTGDRSLASVIAHEISHSWTGNLVTNSNFEHFWLNEGFTVFTERKILSRMFGEKHRQFAAIGGWKELRYITDFMGDSNPLTNLVTDLKGIDPDDAFSTVPYEKGHSLLFYLEQLIGGPEKFELYMKTYIDKFKLKSLITEDWKQFILDYFKQQGMENVFDEVDWEGWLHKPGMPPVNLQFDTSLADICSELKKKWVSVDGSDLSGFSSEDFKDFSPIQKREFLAMLLEEDPLPVEKLAAMDNAYKFSTSKNAEILFRWIRLGLRSHWKDIIHLALKFVVDVGRMKFVRPIYRDLYSWEETRQLAIENYQEHKHEMMYVTAYTVSKDLHLQKLSCSR